MAPVSVCSRRLRMFDEFQHHEILTKHMKVNRIACMCCWGNGLIPPWFAAALWISSEDASCLTRRGHIWKSSIILWLLKQCQYFWTSTSLNIRADSNINAQLAFASSPPWIALHNDSIKKTVCFPFLTKTISSQQVITYKDKTQSN